jgi:hypothetical protein
MGRDSTRISSEVRVLGFPMKRNNTLNKSMFEPSV